MPPWSSWAILWPFVHCKVGDNVSRGAGAGRVGVAGGSRVDDPGNRPGGLVWPFRRGLDWRIIFSIGRNPEGRPGHTRLPQPTGGWPMTGTGTTTPRATRPKATMTRRTRGREIA